jgi:hypothetical protein
MPPIFGFFFCFLPPLSKSAATAERMSGPAGAEGGTRGTGAHEAATDAECGEHCMGAVAAQPAAGRVVGCALAVDGSLSLPWTTPRTHAAGSRRGGEDAAPPGLLPAGFVAVQSRAGSGVALPRRAGVAAAAVAAAAVALCCAAVMLAGAGSEAGGRRVSLDAVRGRAGAALGGKALADVRQMYEQNPAAFKEFVTLTGSRGQALLSQVVGPAKPAPPRVFKGPSLHTLDAYMHQLSALTSQAKRETEEQVRDWQGGAAVPATDGRGGHQAGPLESVCDGRRQQAHRVDDGQRPVAGLGQVLQLLDDALGVLRRPQPEPAPDARVHRAPHPRGRRALAPGPQRECQDLRPLLHGRRAPVHRQVRLAHLPARRLPQNVR